MINGRGINLLFFCRTGGVTGEGFLPTSAVGRELRRVHPVVRKARSAERATGRSPARSSGALRAGGTLHISIWRASVNMLDVFVGCLMPATHSLTTSSRLGTLGPLA